MIKRGNKPKVIHTNTYGGLTGRRDEDMSLLWSLNQFFMRKREKIVMMPKKGTPVVACLSGGLDSVANIAVLLDRFGLEVFPYFINRNQTNLRWEKKAVERLSEWFKSRYPDQFHMPLEIKIETPGRAYKNLLRATKMMQDDVQYRTDVSYPARNPILFLTGAEYAYSLQSQGYNIKHVFFAQQADDWARHGSLTAIRSLNQYWCHITGDWDWEFISIPIEYEFGNHYGKEGLLRYADHIGVPLEWTVSCCKDQVQQCGQCRMACYDRRMAFKKARIEDKTAYENPKMPTAKTATREGYNLESIDEKNKKLMKKVL